MPEIAVNRDGVVGVTWYDRRAHPDNLGWDIRFSASVDGGVTFTPSAPVSARGATFPRGASRARKVAAGVSEQRSDQAQIDAARASFIYMGGDTAGLAADAAGVFHAVWVDNRTGTPQVWTAPISVHRGGRE
jgi:hypothetical protein